MKVFYWSPHLSHVATVSAVINSAVALCKYSQNTINSTIINSIGEWDEYKNELNKKKVNTIDIFSKKSFKHLPKYGFLKSRYSYWKIFLSSFFSLKNLLKKEKPNYLIIHLITSLPIILNFLFNLETRVILRISGYPKLNFLRKYLWKIFGKKLYKIVCPTEATKQYLIDQKIFNKDKIYTLRDPIVNISLINHLKKEQVNSDFLKDQKFILSIGRLTKQKNFLFLIECFNQINKKYPDYKLIIIGEGELETKIKEHINQLNLNSKILILPFQKNIFKYLKKCECFILSSLWEDPGFVLIEAASAETPIISSNCPNGPIEILSNGNGGFLYESNKVQSFINTFDKYKNSSKNDLKKKIIKAKKEAKNYTLFSHYLNLVKVLDKV